MAGRYIGENIRTLYDLLYVAELQNIPGLLLLVDFEKAFDSVSRDFLFNILNNFNFGPSIKNGLTYSMTKRPPLFWLTDLSRNRLT